MGRDEYPQLGEAIRERVLSPDEIATLRQYTDRSTSQALLGLYVPSAGEFTRIMELREYVYDLPGESERLVSTTRVADEARNGVNALRAALGEMGARVAGAEKAIMDTRNYANIIDTKAGQINDALQRAIGDLKATTAIAQDLKGNVIPGLRSRLDTAQASLQGGINDARGRIDALKNDLAGARADFQKNIGEVRGRLQAAGDQVRARVQEGMDGLNARITAIGDVARAYADCVKKAIADDATERFQRIGDSMGPVVDAIKSAATGVRDGFQKAGGSIRDGVAKIEAEVAQIKTDGANMVADLRNRVEGLGFGDLGAVPAGQVPTLTIKNNAGQTIAELKPSAQLSDVFRTAGNAMGLIMEAGVGFGKASAAKEVLHWLGTAIRATIQAAFQRLRDGVYGIVSKIKDAVNRVVEFISNAVNRVRDGFGGIRSRFEESGGAEGLQNLDNKFVSVYQMQAALRNRIGERACPFPMPKVSDKMKAVNL